MSKKVGAGGRFEIFLDSAILELFEILPVFEHQRLESLKRPDSIDYRLNNDSLY